MLMLLFVSIFECVSEVKQVIVHLTRWSHKRLCDWKSEQLTAACVINKKIENVNHFKHECINIDSVQIQFQNVPLYKMHFAATMSRCQTVFGAWTASTMSPDTGSSTHVLKITLIFETKRGASACLMYFFRSTGGNSGFTMCSSNSASFSNRSNCSCRLLFLDMMTSGKSASPFGLQFWHTLNRWLRVRRSNRPKHLAHVCDVINSST